VDIGLLLWVAVEVALEGIEPPRPQLPIGLEPRVDLGQRLEAQLVEAPLGVLAHVHQLGVAKHAKMLGDPGTSLRAGRLTPVMSRAPVLALLMLLAAPAAASARAGDVDGAFGRDGSVTLQSLGADVRAGAIALQPDGKIVATADSGEGLAVVRLTAEGALDRRFGSRGQVQVAVPGASARAVALFRDGRILVAGTVARPAGPGRVVVARLLPSGELDPSFGADGVALVGPEGATVESMAVARDGEVVLGGSVPRGERAAVLVMRLLPDGTPDPDFGTAGEVESDVSLLPGRATGVVVLADGGVAVAAAPELGRIDPGTFVALRLTPAGAFDPAFDGDGVVRVQTTARRLGDGGAAAIALGPGGRLVLAGTSRGSRGRDDATVVRLSPDGALDPRFAGAGAVRLVAPGRRSVHVDALARAPGGRLVLAGRSRGAAAIMRLTAAGRRDRGFALGGLMIAALGHPPGGHRSSSPIAAVAVRSDGRIVTAGASAGRDSFYPTLARLRGP
jgi:uncharacterized delta-60 repeat protein